MTRHKRNIAGAYVADVRAVTTCEDCGDQPVEFHRDEHAEHPEWRIANLVAAGTSVERIQQEIDRSTALCRRCHMSRDGRLDQFVNRPREISAPKPCAMCGKPAKPLRKGLCGACDWRRRRGPTLPPDVRSQRRGAYWREINGQLWKREQVRASKLKAPRTADGRFT